MKKTNQHESPQIFINNLHPILKPETRRLKQFARQMLNRLDLKELGVTIALVDSAQMRGLHKQFLKKQTDTDVLAFPAVQGCVVNLAEGSTNSRELDSPSREAALGEVVLNLDQLKKQAPEYQHTFAEELEWCFLHGMLHLVGYEDKPAGKRKLMDERQDVLWKELRSK